MGLVILLGIEADEICQIAGIKFLCSKTERLNCTPRFAQPCLWVAPTIVGTTIKLPAKSFYCFSSSFFHPLVQLANVPQQYVVAP